MCCIIKFKKKKIRIKKKNNVDVENCESFKGFSYIYNRLRLSSLFPSLDKTLSCCLISSLTNLLIWALCCCLIPSFTNLLIWAIVELYKLIVLSGPGL